jgi:hypothetical protein
MNAQERFDGQIVKAEGYLSRDLHGIHLLQPGCDWHVNLGRSDDLSDARAFHSVLKEIRRRPMMVRLRVTGRFTVPKPGPGEKPGDNLLVLLGSYLHLTEAKVLRAIPLSSGDAARYRDWLDDPRGRPFRPRP